MALTKDQKIATVLEPLLAAIELHKAGRMDDKTLAVMNETTFERLAELDPDGARALLERLKAEAAS